MKKSSRVRGRLCFFGSFRVLFLRVVCLRQLHAVKGILRVVEDHLHIGKRVLQAGKARRQVGGQRGDLLAGVEVAAAGVLAETRQLGIDPSGADGGITLGLLGAALAVANILSLEGLLQAQACGSFAYTSVIVALSAIIPSMSGPVLFGEKVTVSQFAGIGLMIICIILSPGNDGGERRAVNLKWLLFCTVAFVFSGAVGVVQKIHQNNAAHKAEMPALLLTCFFVSFVLSGIKLIIERVRTKKSGERLNKLTPAVVLFPAVSGLCFAFPHTINLFLSGRLASVVFFPTINLCPMLLTMLYAVFGFKERLTAKQWAGIAVGILSTMFVSGII